MTHEHTLELTKMIKNNEILNEFEKEMIQKKSDYFENLKIFEQMWIYATELGVLPLKDPLEDIEKNIKLAKLLNSKKDTNKVERKKLKAEC